MVFALVRMANNMPELFGAGYPRAGLLRRVGRLEQVAGVRLVTLGDGQGRGVRWPAGHTDDTEKSPPCASRASEAGGKVDIISEL